MPHNVAPRKHLNSLLIVAIIALSFLPIPSFALECTQLPLVFEFYLRRHYTHHVLDDTVKKQTIDQYIKALDPSKTMLLESDVTDLKAKLPPAFTAMAKGQCTLLSDTNTLMLSRAKENEEFVKTVLNKDYKLDETASVILDPTKRGYAKTKEERLDTLKKLLHFQISSYLLSDVKMDEAKKNLIHRYELISKRLTDKKPDDVYETFAEAFAVALDPHSSFLSKDSLEDLQIQLQLSLEGIGASLISQDGFTVVDSLIPGGSADRSKLLKPKDKIIAVSQEGQKPVNVIDMDLRDVVKLIRGKKNTKVTLTLLRQAEKTETLDVTIVRDRIDVKDQAAKITYENRKVNGKTLKIGVIDFPSFYGGGGRASRSCSTDLKVLLLEANQQKVDGIVLNLSQNGGGILEEAVRSGGLFIDRGNIVATKNAADKVRRLADDEKGAVYSGPLLVLISRLSASASEILAGALRDYKRAIIAGGDHTFGKGSVQAVADLPNALGGGGVKVTTEMFFIPGGDSTQHIGVPGDILIPSALNNEEIGENTLDYALPSQKVEAFVSPESNTAEGPNRWTPVDPKVFPMLAEKSKARVAKDPKFLEITKSIEESKKNKGLIKLAELRKQSKSDAEKNKKNKKKNEAVSSRKRDEDSPYVQEGVNILVDYIVAEGGPVKAGKKAASN